MYAIYDVVNIQECQTLSECVCVCLCMKYKRVKWVNLVGFFEGTHHHHPTLMVSAVQIICTQMLCVCVSVYRLKFRLKNVRCRLSHSCTGEYAT